MPLPRPLMPPLRRLLLLTLPPRRLMPPLLRLTPPLLRPMPPPLRLLPKRRRTNRTRLDLREPTGS
jgi:hypothetical protein